MNPTDDPIFSLYDTYCHSAMPRREFLRQAAALGGLGLATSLLPNYADACQVNFNDARIHAEYVRFPSPGGNADDMQGYLVRPVEPPGPLPAVVVVHENRGRNPYVEDVARRLALAGYLAIAPDALWAVGGYPGNDDDGKVLQRDLDGAKILRDMENSARYVRAHERANGKLGAVGFCFGGMVCNHLAVVLGDQLQAAVPFYGRPPELDKVPAIRAQLLLQYAEQDDGVNGTRDAHQAALTQHGVAFTAHTYPGTRHGFHNDSTPRFQPEMAALAWDRTLALFETALA